MPQEEIKIKIEKPPIYEAVCNAFKLNLSDKIFTYGDTIYNPSGQELPDHIIEHEKVHMKQQNYNDKDAALWWGRFLRELAFRIDQEARAYAKQYLFICKSVKDRNQRAKIIVDLASVLSGPLYQNSIGQFEAVKEIKKYTNNL